MVKDRVTAIIPAYNEEDRIAATINAVKPFVDEILVVNDGSRDKTEQEAIGSGARVLNHRDNKGYIPAIQWGFQEARGEIVVIIDADGEFPAERIPDLVQPIIDCKAEMVQGSRNIVPRPSERFLTFLANLKAQVGDSGTGFRALRTRLARTLALKGACICGVFSLEVIYKGGRILDVPVILKDIDKSRGVARHHLWQLFFLIPWLIRKIPNQKPK